MKSHKPLNFIFVVQHYTLTRYNGNHNENGVVVRWCVLVQHKLILNIKQYDQKPNKTAQAVIPYFSSNNTVHSPVTMLATEAQVW